jgi:hypothetical protein
MVQLVALFKWSDSSPVAVLGQVLGRSRYRLLFVIVASLVTMLYSLLLPFQYTQRFALANWRYLNTELLAFSVAFGVLLGITITIQVYAIQQAAARQGSGFTVVALIASIVPSLLCCTPLVPTLLALIGLSTMSIYGTSGLIQSFVARYELAFLLGSVGLLLLSVGWSLRLVSTARCVREGGCCQ